MNEQKMPTDEAQNSQKSDWYKNGWGILVAFLFLPFFLMWYMWAKTNWNKKTKWIITGVFAFFILVGAVSDNSATQQAATNTPPVKVDQVKNTPAQPTPIQFTFDVPALVGKNIDEIKTALGKPTTFTEPTKQQLALSDMWDMEYTKDGVTLLVTYNPKTKVVTDFFIDGADKIKLLAQGNIQESSDKYVTEFVKSLKNPNEITGVKISQKLSAELNGKVTYNAVAFKVDNPENYTWTNCKFEINGGTFSSGYTFKSASGIKANDSLIIPFSEFTKDGKRFNFYEQKPENLFISCDTNGQHRSNYFTIN